ncbi:MAG: hypothetical protein RIS35_1561, partial [Pseudomonadota bacterium]
MSLIVEMFAVAVFVAVVLLIEGGYALWQSYRDSESRRLEKRLGQFAALSPEGGAQSLMKQRVFSDWPEADAFLRRQTLARSIDRWLQQTGHETTVSSFLLFTLLGAFAGLLFGVLLNLSMPGQVASMICGGGLPYVSLQRSKSKRLKKFGEQLPEVLELITRALRAGHAFPSAIQMVGT